MSPAPRRRHQKLSQILALQFGNFLKGKPCEVYVAPFDVLLPYGDEEDDEVDTVVQPDLAVFCDKSRLTERGARGAPDLAVEILSPWTSKKDLSDKFAAYERSGVREYWVLDPAAWSVWVYRSMDDGKFDEGELRDRLGDTSPVASRVLTGFVLDPEAIFADLD